MIIDGSKILLLDGATGTELDRRGVDISLPLWSARAISEAPQVLEDIHSEYLAAGANAITANTFRTHRRSLAKAGLGDQAGALSRQAVEIAKRARDEHNPDALVLGSIAPLEDCYKPDLSPDESVCRREHAEMIEHLLDGGVDLLLIETMNNVAEARAAITEAQHRAPGKWIASFCLCHEGEPGILLSGESVSQLSDELSEAYAVGVNCTAAHVTASHVAALRELLPEKVRIAAYANIGYADESGNWIRTDAVEPQHYAQYAKQWIDAGATVVGGCCGTTPQTIRAIATLLRGATTPGAAGPETSGRGGGGVGSIPLTR